ncbi:MAG: hypothetical protein AB7L90_05510 [Hyphomicrobiaceae bacterium]
MDFEAELKHLKRRMDDLEGIVNAVAVQFRAIHPELAALKAETSRRFDAADDAIARIANRLDSVNTQIWSLRDDLPILLRQAMQARSSNGPRE